MEYTIKVEIDLSDSLKEFIKDIKYHGNIPPMSDEEWAEISQPEMVEQLQGQMDMDEILAPVTEQKVTKEDLINLVKPYGNNPEIKEQFKEILKSYGAVYIKNLNEAHYSDVYNRFKEIIDA